MASKVYLKKTGDNPKDELVAKSALEIFNYAGVLDHIQPNDYVAIKVHFGEKNNTTHISPEVIASLVTPIKEKGSFVFLTETSTLYKGERDNAVKHIHLAYEHGFTIDRVGAPVILADGLMGDYEVDVPIKGELNKSVKIATDARKADFLLIVSHLTGHIGAGFGATIKNLGMGLASRKGKLRQHSSVKPEVITENCVLCRKCIKWCPEDAISELDGVANINSEKCIGCGECLTVCRFEAIKFDFSKESGLLQKEIAEHALGAVKDKKCFYINVCVNMTSGCDCFAINQQKFIPDVGVLGSWDPVALDQASIDLTANKEGANINAQSYPQIPGNIQLEHSEKIGLGTREYEIVNL